VCGCTQGKKNPQYEYSKPASPLTVLEAAEGLASAKIIFLIKAEGEIKAEQPIRAEDRRPCSYYRGS